jgi:hypothetical protein
MLACFQPQDVTNLMGNRISEDGLVFVYLVRGNEEAVHGCLKVQGT